MFAWNRVILLPLVRNVFRRRPLLFVGKVPNAVSADHIGFRHPRFPHPSVLPPPRSYYATSSSISRGRGRPRKNPPRDENAPERRYGHYSRKIAKLARGFIEPRVVDQLDDIVQQMRDEELSPDLAVYNSLLAAYGRAGELKSLMMIFEQAKAMPQVAIEPELYSTCYHTMSSLCQKERIRNDALLEAVTRVHEDMQRNRVRVDSIGYNVLLKTYRILGDVEAVLRVEDEMRTFGITMDNFTYCNILEATTQDVKYIDELERAYECLSVEGKTLTKYIYNKIIRAVANEGNARFALDLVNDLRHVHRCTPEPHVCLAVMQAQVNLGLFDEALSMWDGLVAIDNSDGGGGGGGGGISTDYSFSSTHTPSTTTSTTTTPTELNTFLAWADQHEAFSSFDGGNEHVRMRNKQDLFGVLLCAYIGTGKTAVAWAMLKANASPDARSLSRVLWRALEEHNDDLIDNVKALAETHGLTLSLEGAELVQVRPQHLQSRHSHAPDAKMRLLFTKVVPPSLSSSSPSAAGASEDLPAALPRLDDDALPQVNASARAGDSTNKWDFAATRAESGGLLYDIPGGIDTSLSGDRTDGVADVDGDGVGGGGGGDGDDVGGSGGGGGGVNGDVGGDGDDVGVSGRGRNDQEVVVLGGFDDVGSTSETFLDELTVDDYLDVGEIADVSELELGVEDERGPGP